MDPNDNSLIINTLWRKRLGVETRRYPVVFAPIIVGLWATFATRWGGERPDDKPTETQGKSGGSTSNVDPKTWTHTERQQARELERLIRRLRNPSVWIRFRQWLAELKRRR